MPIFIDGHVHIYPEFPVDQFLTAAWDNFARIADSSKVSGDFHSVLALAEGQGFDVFSTLKRQAVPLDDCVGKQKFPSAWSFYRTDEPDSLTTCKGKASMVIVAGRQIISKENIELLSLLSSFKVEDRTLSLADLANTVAAGGGLSVVPWGVGKWWGAKGRVVERLFHSRCDYPLFLGDNGNRPSFWPEPALLRQARDLNVPVVSGSDPLPLISHLSHPGSFGALLRQGELSMQYPAASLRKLLVSKKDISSFGSRTGSFQFVVDQVRINMRKQYSRISRKF